MTSTAHALAAQIADDADRRWRKSPAAGRVDRTRIAATVQALLDDGHHLAVIAEHAGTCGRPRSSATGVLDAHLRQLLGTDPAEPSPPQRPDLPDDYPDRLLPLWDLAHDRELRNLSWERDGRDWSLSAFDGAGHGFYIDERGAYLSLSWASEQAALAIPDDAWTRHVEPAVDAATPRVTALGVAILGGQVDTDAGCWLVAGITQPERLLDRLPELLDVAAAVRDIARPYLNGHRP